MEKDYMQVLTTSVDGTAGQVAVNTGNQNGIEWRDMPAGLPEVAGNEGAFLTVTGGKAVWTKLTNRAEVGG